MRTGSIIGIVAVLALSGCATAPGAKNALGGNAEVCPPPTVFTSQLKYLDGYRFFTGPDGDSAVEPLRIEAKQVPLLKTGAILGLFQLPSDPTRGVQIVVGPPNLELPLHPAPYKEMFIMISGGVTVKTQKFSAEMKPGSVLLFEDVDARVGHGGMIGPCGYVSVSIKP